MLPNSQESQKILNSKKGANNIDNICSHFVLVNLFDKEQKKIIKTKKYNYFSAFKNYLKEMKEIGVQEVSRCFYKIYDDLNENTEFISFHEKAKFLVLAHFNKDKAVSNLISLTSQEEVQRKVDYQVLALNTQAQIHQSPDVINGHYFTEISRLTEVSNDWIDDEAEVCDNKVFIICLDHDRLHTTAHLGKLLILTFLGVIVNALRGIVDPMWLKSKKLNISGLREWTENHLEESLKLFSPKKKYNFLKTKYKIALGDDTIDPYTPVFALNSPLYKILNHVNMVQTGLQSFQIPISPKMPKLGEKKNLSKKQLKVFIFSWNLAGYYPKLSSKEECEALTTKIFSNMNDPDLIIINLQELIELKPNSSVVLGMFQSEIPEFQNWTKFMKFYFLAKYPDYICINKSNLLGLGTFHFVHKRNSKHINHIFTDNLKFGFMGAIPNKGSIMSSLHLYDSTFVFVNVHLPSGQTEEDIKARSSKMEEMLKAISNESQLAYDMLFMAGDLNLRCYADWPYKSEKLSELEAEMQADGGQALEEYRKTDEVIGGTGLHTVLGDIFTEGELQKLPSYKVKRGADEMTFVADRRPSWTDRIFFHWDNEEVLVKGTEQRSCYFEQSDHM